MKTLEQILLTTNRWVLILLLGSMAMIIFANVLLRYLTSESLVWAEEVARHLMIWLTFLGSGLVLRYGGHVAVDNLQDSLPRAAAVALRLVVAALMFGFFAFMIWQGMQYLDRTRYQVTTATQIPIAYVYAAMPIGGGLLTVHWLLIVRSFVRSRGYAVDDHFDSQASASL